MTSHRCQANCTSNKSNPNTKCTNTALYDVPERGLLCGSHAKNIQNKLEYSIKKAPNMKQPRVEEQEEIIIHETAGGPYSPLSNLYECSFKLRDIEWRSAENAYQGLRFYWESSNHETTTLLMDLVKKISIIQPLKAREIGDKHSSFERKDWLQKGTDRFSVRDRFMMEILVAKFSSNELIDILLSTGDKKIIIISNTERYWSFVQGGSSENRLGEILMIVRNRIKLMSVDN